MNLESNIKVLDSTSELGTRPVVPRLQLLEVSRGPVLLYGWKLVNSFLVILQVLEFVKAGWYEFHVFFKYFVQKEVNVGNLKHEYNEG